MTTSFTQTIRLRLNGEVKTLTLQSPTQTLMRVLHLFGLTGTKEGCGDGDCGACTVACRQTIDGHTQWRAINSCLMPAAIALGMDIKTVEGVACANALHPVQRALIDSHGSQCGYCTPGFVMSLYAGFENQQLSDATVEGNLCRCTGYTSIRRAIGQLQASLRDVPHKDAAVAEPLATRTDVPGWHFPDSISTAIALKQQYPDAQFVAGSTDLGLDFSHARAGNGVFIALESVPELRRIDQLDAHYRIGAGVPLSRVEVELRGLYPALDTMLHWFAAKQVRNRATIGGNLGTASPIGDLLPVLLALDAEIILQSTRGMRSLPIENYFLGYRSTAKAADELIVAVQVQAPNSSRINASYKVGKRGSDDISIVAASFELVLDDQRRIAAARLAFGGVAATPMRAIKAETLLLGRPITSGAAELCTADITAALQSSFTPLSDMRGSAGYRQQLVVNLWRQFVADHLHAKTPTRDTEATQ